MRANLIGRWQKETSKGLQVQRVEELLDEQTAAMQAISSTLAILEANLLPLSVDRNARILLAMVILRAGYLAEETLARDLPSLQELRDCMSLADYQDLRAQTFDAFEEVMESELGEMLDNYIRVKENPG
jgi:hypothetical protein